MIKNTKGYQMLMRREHKDHPITDKDNVLKIRRTAAAPSPELRSIYAGPNLGEKSASAYLQTCSNNNK